VLCDVKYPRGRQVICAEGSVLAGEGPDKSCSSWTGGSIA